jgi:hypothetical protein
VAAFVGVAALAATTTIATVQPSAAQSTPELTAKDEIVLRGTIVSINPANRLFVISSPERDELVYKAADRVTNFGSLKEGMTVDVRYYRVMDFLVAKTTPEVTSQAAAMIAKPARAPGVPGSQMAIALWQVSGMVVRTDMPAKKMEVVDPMGGMIYRTPWIKSAAGQAVLQSLKPGDLVTAVFSQRTALEVTPVR